MTVTPTDSRAVPAPVRPLRICVLAHSSGRSAGGRSVSRNIIATLGRVAPEHHYSFVVTANAGYEEICGQVPGSRCVPVHLPAGTLRRLKYEHDELPRLVAGLGAQVLWDLGNYGLIHPPCPQAILVQNSYLFYPPRHYGRQTLAARVKVRYQVWRFARALRRTDLVFCQTEVARERLRRKYEYSGRIALCPNAVSVFTSDDDPHPPMPEPLRPYADKMRLFCLAEFYSHKNLESLIALFQRFGRELSDVVVVTTVEADQHPHAGPFLRAVARAGLADRIVNVGQLPQQELAAYYRNCHALFLPTLLESYTSTYLEAARFGCPIITSDLDFAHAVCGDAAIYCDPWDTASMKEAICRLKDNPALAAKLTSRAADRLRAVERSWDDIIAGVVTELAAIAHDGPRRAAAEHG